VTLLSMTSRYLGVSLLRAWETKFQEKSD